jgi:hypothetical protein
VLGESSFVSIMTRTVRLPILAAFNWLFWVVLFGLPWHRQIPERLTLPIVLLSQLFAWPVGLLWVSLWFLVNAQLHTVDWRLRGQRRCDVDQWRRVGVVRRLALATSNRPRHSSRVPLDQVKGNSRGATVGD